MLNTLNRRVALQHLLSLPVGMALGQRTFGQENNEGECTGIVEVTRGAADLVVPRDGEGFRYGTGYLFQVSPTQAGVLCNLRTEGFPVGDFEAGVDAVLFDDPAKISTKDAVPVTRTVKYADRVTGQGRIVIKHGVKGAFVPFGACRADGSPHPHAGTGVGFCAALDFPLKGNGYYDKRDKTGDMVRKVEVQQFEFDGRKFRVSWFDTYTQAKPLCASGSEWKLYSPPLNMGLADGDDLLFAAAATSNNPSEWFSDPHAAGVSRWRRIDEKWQPVEFIPVIIGRMPKKPHVVYGRKMSVYPIEPTLIRDVDGSLLFTARFAYQAFDERAIRVWRSTDRKTWDKIIEVPDIKGQAPVSIARAVDGTPYLVSNPIGRERDKLVLWPLNGDRSSLGKPIIARDVLEEFGKPPGGPVWFMDHPNAAVVRLADGRWHNLLSYRIMDRGEHSGKAPPPQSGHYVEEVFSSGAEIPSWNFS